MQRGMAWAGGAWAWQPGITLGVHDPEPILAAQLEIQGDPEPQQQEG